MKRRKALQNIVIISSGMALLPACSSDEVLARPTYSNLPLDNDQSNFIAYLTRMILPKDGLDINTPEPTSHFVLKMLNDCYAPEDIEKYISGMKLFKQYIQDEYKISFKRLNPQQQILAFTELTESNIFPKNLQYFLNTTKSLTIRHFTSSEFFMKNYLDFEFVPGRYTGCVAL